MATLTEEEENFLRIFKLINGIASKAARKKFDQCFPTLGSFLQANEKKIRQSPYLKGHQILKLFPTSGIRSSSSFDIILMITLIRNFSPSLVQKPSNGFDKLPLPTELFDGAYLAIVKYYRNEIAHSQKDTLTNSEFQKMWKDLSEASIGLGGANFKTECDQLIRTNLDNDIIVNLRQEFQEMREDMEQKLTDEINRVQEIAVKCSCHDFHQIEIADWEKQNIKFVAINAKDAVLRYIKKVRRATVTGIPGSGKSALIQHIALSLRDQKGYIIIPCSKPSEIIDHYRKDVCQVFVVNDSCGRSVLNHYDVVEWKKHTPGILDILNKGKTILLSSCRSQVFQEPSYKTIILFSCQFCDLSAGVYELSLDEKVEIAKTYMPPEIVENINEELQTCKMVPLLSSCYERDPKSDVKLFFQNPVLVYNDKLDELANECDKTKFFSLFLSVVHNGSIPKDLNKFVTRQLLEEMFEIFGVNRGTCTSTIIEQLKSLTGMFLIKSEGGYTMIHDKLFDILCAYFGKRCQQSLIKFAHSKVIYERTWLRHENEKERADTDNLTIFLDSCYEDDYFERILKDMRIGNIIEVFYCQQMENAEFRGRLIRFMQTQDQPVVKSLLNIRDKVQKVGVDTAFHIVCALGYDDLFRYFLYVTENVNMFASDEFPPLYQACFYGNGSIVKLFIEKGAKLNVSTEYGFTPLIWACLGEEIQMIELLLANEANINLCVSGRSPILEACSIQNSKILDTLLKHGAETQVSDGDEETLIMKSAENGLDRHVEILLPHYNVDQYQILLFEACKKGYLKLVQLLIQHDINLNNVDDSGMTSLAYACEYGQSTIVKVLIESGCQLTPVDNCVILPLVAACRSRHRTIIEYLMEMKIDVNSSLESGWTALMEISEIGDVCILKTLLDNGASSNHQDYQGKTPLMIVSERGDAISVQILINSGADVNQRDEIGLTAFILACDNMKFEVIRVLSKTIDISHVLEDIDGKMPLLRWLEPAYYTTTKLLIELKLDINLQNTRGHTPLEEAIIFSNDSAIKFLLENGANLNITNNEGHTPLLIACIKKKYQLIQYLVKKGADVHILDNFKSSALHLLCRNNIDMFTDTEIVSYAHSNIFDVDVCDEAISCLIDKGLQIDSIDITGRTPLVLACLDKNIRLAQLLVKKGAGVNINSHNPQEFVKSNGMTPLMIACNNVDVDLADFLIRKGANVNKTDVKGVTPLMIACNNVDIDLAYFLIGKGAHVNMTDVKGVTPLMIACNNVDVDLAYFLIGKGAHVNMTDVKGESALHKLYEGQTFFAQNQYQLLLENKRKTLARKLLNGGMFTTFDGEYSNCLLQVRISRFVRVKDIFRSVRDIDTYLRKTIDNNQPDIITDLFLDDAIKLKTKLSVYNASLPVKMIQKGYSSIELYLKHRQSHRADAHQILLL